MSNGDQPAHIVSIPDSLGRDVDKARAGRLKQPLDVEAFMSPEALQQIQDASTTAPVHAEDLVPISREEGARRVTFDGEHLPKAPATRRVIPAPFQRPRFDLDRHGRAWTTCRAEDVKKDDVVPDVGRIARDAEQVIRREPVAGYSGVATGVKVILTNVAGDRAAFDLGQSVRAFRPAE